MKKLLSVLLILVMVFSFAACGNGGENGGSTGVDYDAIPDEFESEDGVYEVAMVTDVGQLKDGSFNQYTWNGVKKYASDNELSYKYYQPANASNATDADRIKAMTDACEAGAKVLVTPGFLQAPAIEEVAVAYPEVQFIFVDGWDLGLDNVMAISYQEEQAGYFAGYATVMEGYTKLGYSGGGGGTNPACIRYGYGFAQGANAAAAEKDVTVEMRYSWEHGSNFTSSPDLQAMLTGWYNAGTEAIFVCGGTMGVSGMAAAEATDGAMIGVDTDQSDASEAIFTSAMKDLAGSVVMYVGKYYEEGLMTGAAVLGVADNMVGIPTETWSLENWTVEEYEALYEKVVAGDIVIDSDDTMADPSKAGLDNIKFVK